MIIEERKAIQKKISLTLVETFINRYGWFPFGNEKFECKGFEKSKDFYLKNSQLPEPCNICYKALIFWSGVTTENINNFFNMIYSFDVNYHGKLNKGVVVFYFRDKEKMLNFLEFLQQKMQEFNVKGKIQWRRACADFQKLKPELWKNAKEFISPTV